VPVGLSRVLVNTIVDSSRKHGEFAGSHVPAICSWKLVRPTAARAPAATTTSMSAAAAITMTFRMGCTFLVLRPFSSRVAAADAAHQKLTVAWFEQTLVPAAQTLYV
jgi:hypothetical protein